MADEHSGTSGAQRPAAAAGEMSEPAPNEGRDGPASGTAEFVWGDPEQFYESLFAHLEAEAQWIRADRCREPDA